MMGKWLEEHKPMLFRDLVSDYFDNRIFWKKLLETFQTSGQLPYPMLEHWVGSETRKGKLWNLKDQCHRLLRNNDLQRGSLLKYFFDWIIGSIFHQCMKLKEDVYLLEAYAPRYEKITGRLDLNSSIAQTVQEMEHRINTIRTSLKKELEEVASLFQAADRHLLRLFPQHAHNALLARFMIHDRNKIEQVYGKNSLDSILEAMYPAGRHEAYYMAGISYLEGGWYEEAAYLFQTGLAIAPGHEGLRKALAEARNREEQKNTRSTNE